MNSLFNFLLTYLLESSFCLLIFGVLYICFFRNNTFHFFNRILLIIITLSALTIPLLNVTISYPANGTLSGIMSRELPSLFDPSEFHGNPNSILQVPVATREVSDQSGHVYDTGTTVSWPLTIFLIYFGGLLVLLIRLISNLAAILLLRAKADYCEKNGHFLLCEQNYAFSFFGWIFIGRKLADDRDFQIILSHERIHVQNFHSADVIFFELIKVFFWFHPVIYFLSRESRLVNEYYTDKQMTKSTGLEEYTNALFHSKDAPATINFSLNIANSFALLSLKSRVMQLIKKQTNTRKMYYYLTYVPITAMLFFLFSCEIQDAVSDPGEIRSVKAYFHDEYGDQGERNGNLVVNLDLSETNNPVYQNQNSGYFDMSRITSFIQWGPEAGIIQYRDRWPVVYKDRVNLAGNRFLEIWEARQITVVDEEGARTSDCIAEVQRDINDEGFEIVRIFGYDDKKNLRSVFTVDLGEKYVINDRGLITTLWVNKQQPGHMHITSVNRGSAPRSMKELPVTEAERYDFSYDLSGNLIESRKNGKLDKTFSYGQENQLTEVRVFKNNKLARYYTLQFEGADQLESAQAFNANEEIEYSLRYEYQYY